MQVLISFQQSIMNFASSFQVDATQRPAQENRKIDQENGEDNLEQEQLLIDCQMDFELFQESERNLQSFLERDFSQVSGSMYLVKIETEGLAETIDSKTYEEQLQKRRLQKRIWRPKIYKRDRKPVRFLHLSSPVFVKTGNTKKSYITTRRRLTKSIEAETAKKVTNGFDQSKMKTFRYYKPQIWDNIRAAAEINAQLQIDIIKKISHQKHRIFRNQVEENFQSQITIIKASGQKNNKKSLCETSKEIISILLNNSHEMMRGKVMKDILEQKIKRNILHSNRNTQNLSKRAYDIVNIMKGVDLIMSSYSTGSKIYNKNLLVNPDVPISKILNLRENILFYKMEQIQKRKEILRQLTAVHEATIKEKVCYTLGLKTCQNIKVTILSQQEFDLKVQQAKQPNQNNTYLVQVCGPPSPVVKQIHRNPQSRTKSIKTETQLSKGEPFQSNYQSHLKVCTKNKQDSLKTQQNQPKNSTKTKGRHFKLNMKPKQKTSSPAIKGNESDEIYDSDEQFEKRVIRK